MTEQKGTNRDQELIRKQPVFKRQEGAVELAMKKISAKEDYPEIWREPNDGDFVVANEDAFEALYRNGYKKILDAKVIKGFVETGEKTHGNIR